MIQDKTIDETLVELARTMKALQALRAARRRSELHQDLGGMPWYYGDQIKEHAAAKRATLDLTRKLADLRASR